MRTKKHEILTLQGCYHGRTYGATSIGTPVGAYSKSQVMSPYAPGAVHVPAPYCYRCSLGHEYPNCHIQCAKMIEDIINFGSSRDVAAYMAEPILGVGGIVTRARKKTKEPGTEECKRIRMVCADHGLIVGLGGFWSNVIRVQPPLTIREEHIDKASEALEKAVKEVETQRK